MKYYSFLLGLIVCCILPCCGLGKKENKKTTKVVEKEVAVDEAVVTKTPPKDVADLDFQDLEDLSDEE